MPKTASHVIVRKARITDVEEIRAIVMAYADAHQMLPRSLRYIYDNLRNYFVAENGDGHVLGCGALQVAWEGLAEIKSVAVKEELRGKGVGRLLVQTCLDEASEIDVPRVFVLSFVPEFFEKLGFRRISRQTLPHKIWNECIDCPLFPECGETALVIDVPPRKDVARSK